jgi:hypothetical protein
MVLIESLYMFCIPIEPAEQCLGAVHRWDENGSQNLTAEPDYVQKIPEISSSLLQSSWEIAMRRECGRICSSPLDNVVGTAFPISSVYRDYVGEFVLRNVPYRSG